MITAAHPTTGVSRDAALFYPESRSLSRPAIKKVDVTYPESDGKPMGETGFHVRAILHLYNALDQFFQARADVYVAADMFLYYQQGNPRANRSPDVMVIKGVEKFERRTFKIWEEPARPCCIVEVTSKSTAVEDLVDKHRLYETLGIREYFLFDPLREYIEQGLIGFRLEGDRYVPLTPDAEGRIASEELGVWLTAEEHVVRVIDGQTGRRIPSLGEAIEWAQQETQRAEQEAQRAQQEADRAAHEAQQSERLRAQLRALGVEPSV